MVVGNMPRKHGVNRLGYDMPCNTWEDRSQDLGPRFLLSIYSSSTLAIDSLVLISMLLGLAQILRDYDDSDFVSLKNYCGQLSKESRKVATIVAVNPMSNSQCQSMPQLKIRIFSRKSHNLLPSRDLGLPRSPLMDNPCSPIDEMVGGDILQNMIYHHLEAPGSPLPSAESIALWEAAPNITGGNTSQIGQVGQPGGVYQILGRVCQVKMAWPSAEHQMVHHAKPLLNPWNRTAWAV